jgi:hypothetical protein
LRFQAALEVKRHCMKLKISRTTYRGLAGFPELRDRVIAAERGVSRAIQLPQTPQGLRLVRVTFTVATIEFVKPAVESAIPHTRLDPASRSGPRQFRGTLSRPLFASPA